MFIPSHVQKEYNENFLEEKPKFYTRVPKIIDSLTFIVKEPDKTTGELCYFRRKLSACDKNLYRVIFDACGDNGVCWKSTETLADEAGCSVGQVVESKKRLIQAFEQLDGHPLIYIEEIHKRTIKEDRILNKTFIHKIHCRNIWKWNNAYMSVRKHMPKLNMRKITDQEAEVSIEKMRQGNEGWVPHYFVHNSGARSENESAGRARSENECASQGARSENEPIKTYQTPYDKKAYLALTSKQEMLLTKNVKENATEIHGWLRAFGIGKKVIEDFLDRFRIENLAEVINNFRQSFKHIIIKTSVQGYLIWKINQDCRVDCYN